MAVIRGRLSVPRSKRRRVASIPLRLRRWTAVLSVNAQSGHMYDRKEDEQRGCLRWRGSAVAVRRRVLLGRGVLVVVALPGIVGHGGFVWWLL